MNNSDVNNNDNENDNDISNDKFDFEENDKKSMNDSI